MASRWRNRWIYFQIKSKGVGSMVDIKKELSSLLDKEVNIETYNLIKEIK